MAQMSTVRMFMGIGGVMNRFVKKRRTIPMRALTTNLPKCLPPRHIRIMTINPDKKMSASASIKHQLTPGPCFARLTEQKAGAP